MTKIGTLPQQQSAVNDPTIDIATTDTPATTLFSTMVNKVSSALGSLKRAMLRFLLGGA